jgi:hypothetical protein
MTNNDDPQKELMQIYLVANEIISKVIDCELATRNDPENAASITGLCAVILKTKLSKLTVQIDVLSSKVGL